MARAIALPLDGGVEPQKNDLLLLTISRSTAWADLAILVGNLVALEWAISLAVEFFLNAPDSHSDAFPAFQRGVLIPLLSIRAVGVVLLLALLLRARGLSTRSLGLSSGKLGRNLLFGVGATGAAYALQWLWLGLAWFFFPTWLDMAGENLGRLQQMIPRLTILGYVPMALVIGIYEELLFRGFIMPRLRRGTGSWFAAVVLSTALFTALHAVDQTVTALVPITILSLVFSVAMIWRRSLIPAIVGHFLFNYTQFLGMLYLSRHAST